MCDDDTAGDCGGGYAGEGYYPCELFKLDECVWQVRVGLGGG